MVLVRGGRVKDLPGVRTTSCAAAWIPLVSGPQAVPFKYGAKRAKRRPERRSGDYSEEKCPVVVAAGKRVSSCPIPSSAAYR